VLGGDEKYGDGGDWRHFEFQIGDRLWIENELREKRKE
jgi:hypothetical protein